MRLLHYLVPSALLAASVAQASAEEISHDVITLTSGERLVGELLDVRDGQYRVLLTDGRMVSVNFRTAARVEMGGASTVPVPVDQLPLPDWHSTVDGEQYERPVAGGFDFGLTQGARLRFRMSSPAVAHVDLRLGLGLVFGNGVAPSALAGVDIAFFNDKPVHLTLSGTIGPAIVWGSVFPFIGAGPGVQFDLKGPAEVHLGLTLGTTFQSVAVTPDFGVSWVW